MARADFANGKVIEVVDLEPGMEPVLFKNLTPGSYALRWLGDPNGNGRWDDVSRKMGASRTGKSDARSY